MARIQSPKVKGRPAEPGKQNVEPAAGTDNRSRNTAPPPVRNDVPDLTPPVPANDAAPRLTSPGTNAPGFSSSAFPLLEGKQENAAAQESSEPGYVAVNVAVVCGGLTNIKVPITVTGRYDGLALAGPTKAFDRLLDSWLTRALDLRMIGSGLGQLFPINLQHAQEMGKVKTANLLLAGMGEPGRFAADDLRFLMCNVTVAVKTMGHDQFAIGLIGTRRKELGIFEAIRSFLAGIVDGYERLSAIAMAVKDGARLREAAKRPISVILVDPDEKTASEIKKKLDELQKGQLMPGVKLDVIRGADIDPDPPADSGAADTEAAVAVTLLRVRRADANPNAGPAREKPTTGGGEKPAVEGAGMEADVFEFSALSEVAAAPIREVEINPYFVRELPDRLINASSPQERERFGTFFANCMIPEDFCKLTEGSANLNFEVDESTAMYPWEMLAHNKYSRTSFLSTSVAVSRQFSSQLAPPPTSPPPLNRTLRALIIADPAPGKFKLPNARLEGIAIVEMIDRARRSWRGEYDITAVLRIGCKRDAGDLEQRMLDGLRKQYDWLTDVNLCDPLEAAALVVNDQYDLIHYAGHGFANPKTGYSGWVFAEDCYLSAKEIFRVRQVPRLVFANACFSAVTNDHKEQREHLVGLAKAFFARGIPNFIGTGWEVDDACAQECARWFYACILGLSGPAGDLVGTSPPATIGEALRSARNAVLALNGQSSSWGAYQHYGHVGDKLLALPNARPDGSSDDGAGTRASAGTNAPSASFAAAAPSAGAQTPPTQGGEKPKSGTGDDLLYVNGIDFETGQYAFKPRSIDDVAKQIMARPGGEGFMALHAEEPRSFAVPYDMTPEKLEEAGWGVVFHEDTPQEVRTALDPLIAARRKQAGDRLKVLDYKKGEQIRAWYQRHRVSAGNLDPEIVPYYLLLVGPPGSIPFDFQYLLSVEYAVGRLAFATAAEYDRYVRSVIDYESAQAAANRKEISYWGTRHQGDPATNLSAALLIDPLANGVPGSAGSLKRPVHVDRGYGRSLFLGDDATKANFLTMLHAERPPAMLFTASHGMQLRAGQPNQNALQGALLCQDWTGFGSVKPEHLLAAADIDDDANVKGLVALIFACFGAGTPDLDQFPMDMAQAGKTPALAPQPFIAALPNRLLAHPKGGALAVIGHVDRAWGFSIQPSKSSDAQIGTFRNSLGFILKGIPVGHAMSNQFGGRFAMLATSLGSATSPTAPAYMRLSDKDLVACWLERNDAQNYILLGDPAVRIREDLKA